jgi:type II secretion system protein H
MRRNSGFTLVEMSVVIAVLVLMTGIVVPNLVALKRSRDLATLEASVARLPVDARNEARTARVPVALRVDNGALVLERRPTNADPQEVTRVALNDDLKVDSARTGDQTIDFGSWTWTVYPDGSAEAAGLTFVEGQDRKAMVLSADGGAQWINGDLPDQGTDTWPAGQLEQRS